MTVLEEDQNETFTVIANADGQPEAIFSSHQQGVEEFEKRLDGGATNLDLIDSMTATEILGTIELSQLPNMISGQEWPGFAHAVRAGYENTINELPELSKQFLRDGVQPDIPSELAQNMLHTLDYYTSPRFPEFQYACELTEIVLAEREERSVNFQRFCDASMNAREPYSMLYLAVTSDVLEDGLKQEQSRRNSMHKDLNPAEAPAALCNAEMSIQKLEYALQHLRPDQRIKEDQTEQDGETPPKQ